MAGLIEKLNEEIGRLREAAAQFPEVAAQFGAAGVIDMATKALASYSASTPADTAVVGTIDLVVTTRYKIENKTQQGSAWLTVFIVGAIGAGLWWYYRERE